MTASAKPAKPAKPPSDRVFFTLAALYAAAIVPAWTLTWTGGPILWPLDHGVAAHGHEMILGFAGALFSGFLFTRLSRRGLGLVVAAWAVGRVAVLAGAPPPVQALALAAHPAALLAYGAWPFLRAAKTLHNAVPGLALAGLVGAEGLYVAGLFGLIGGTHAGVMLGFGLVALMLFAMGGRLIPAATAGALRAKGQELPMARRLQRRAEAVGAVALGTMAVLDAVAALGLLSAAWAGGAAVVAGGAALLRLSRWRMGALLDQAALWPLHLGYGWLGAGLVLKGLGQWGVMPGQAALHGAAIGGLGIIAATVSWRTVRQRGAQPLAPARLPPRLPVVVAGLISVSAVLRLGGATEPLALAWAAVLWSLAWLLLVPRLWRAT